MWLDVAKFIAAPPSCVALDTSCQPCLANMQSKSELYGGEFMAGFALLDCPEFEEWLQIQRETLHIRALALLERIATCHEQAGSYTLALSFALRQAEMQPWDEATCRRVMRLYARNDQHSTAINHFDTFCQHLKLELGVLPSEENKLLARSIQSVQLQHELLSIVKMPALPTMALLPAGRRQVTVLYCELSQFQIPDPEDALPLVATAQTHCASIIKQHGGHIVQAYGGGLLAYFGFPKAHENAARRAVQSALAITRDAGHGVDIRAGVHSGLIISGADSNLPDSGGRTSKVAINIRKMAGAGQAVISGETQRLVGGYFDCSSLGLTPPNSMTHTVEVFQVLKESRARTRLDAAGQLTPLVGRTTELAQLISLWYEVTQGARQVVLIQGDAGIGKSRLLLAMKERLAGTPHMVRDVLCSPECFQTPFQPIIAMLEIVFGFNQGDAPELKSVKLRQYLQTQYPASATKAIPLVAELLFLPSAEQFSAVSADIRKAQTITILLDLFQALASKQPTLLVVEDAHWMDASSLEFLNQLVTRKNRGRHLVAITARANFCAPWHNTPVTTINLCPLVPMEIEAILAWRGADMAYAMRLRIVERADGVPLFAEEMANMVNLDQTANVPETLYDLLAARLDHMGEANLTAQLASTLGREFDLNLLAKIFPHGADALARTLSALDASGLIVSGLGADRKFKHSLIQEVAYQSQTKADQQAVHLLIAQVLQRDFCELVANQPELLARHLSDGGSTHQAIKYWIKAGQLGIERSAYLEAIEDFNSGLALLPQLLVDKEREALALALHVGMEAALVGAKEKRPTEAERVFQFPAVVWS